MAHYERSAEVDAERDPVLRLVEREGVERRQEEKVEREHAGHGRSDCICPAEGDRDHHHREDIDHAEAHIRRKRTQGIDQSGGSGHGCDREEQRVEALHVVKCTPRAAFPGSSSSK